MSGKIRLCFSGLIWHSFFPCQFLIAYVLYVFLQSFLETNQPNILKKISRQHQNQANVQTPGSEPESRRQVAFLPCLPRSAARPLSRGPTLATCRGCFCSLPPCSRKPQGAPPVMEMQIKSPVPILSSQLGSMKGWRRRTDGCRLRRGKRAQLPAPAGRQDRAPSLGGSRASATCARRRARRQRGPGPLPRHAPRSAHLRGGEGGSRQENVPI